MVGSYLCFVPSFPARESRKAYLPLRSNSACRSTLAFCATGLQDQAVSHIKRTLVTMITCQQKRERKKAMLQKEHVEKMLTKLDELRVLYREASEIVSQPELLLDLAESFASGELILSPEFQRKSVWTPDKSSKLVASVLLGQYIPAILLQERVRIDDSGNMIASLSVVDGKQRLSALFGFIFSEFGYHALQAGCRLKVEGSDKDQLKDPPNGFDALKEHLPDLKQLSDLDEDLDGLNGLRFSYLTADWRHKLLHYKINVFKVPRKVDTAALFRLFRGINAGSVNLSDQQLRAAIYDTGHEYLLEISEMLKDPCFQAIRVGEVKQVQDKNADLDTAKDFYAEQILCALACRYASKDSSYSSSKARTSFLNEEVRRFAMLDTAAKEDMKKKVSREFKDVMEVATDIFPIQEAFRNPLNCTQDIRPRLWESIYCAILEILEERKIGATEQCVKATLTFNLEAIQRAMKSSLKTKSFTKVLNATSFSRINIRKRINLVKKVIIDTCTRELPMLEALIAIEETNGGDRNFSPKLRGRKWKEQGYKCGICDQEIHWHLLQLEKRVELDHIHPYAAGGETTDDNCMLTHVICNRWKGMNRIVK